jgi:hypothetical protein
MTARIAITAFFKEGGPLTKSIFLGPDGQPISDGSACVMSRGLGIRVWPSGLSELAEVILALEPPNAIALGSLRADLPDRIKITTHAALHNLNGMASRDTIAPNPGVY